MMQAVACAPAPLHLEGLRLQLEQALGPGTGVACTGVEGDPQRLWPVEHAAIRRAVPRRQREFAAGRTAARTAMAQLGWPPLAVPSATDRSPIWPEGLVGSIAHTARVCVVIAGRRDQVHAMGIDIEENLPLEPNLWEAICTPEELCTVASLPLSEQGPWVTRLFCAKEAFYKWQHPQTGRMLDFRDVQVTLNQHCSGFSVQRAKGGKVPVITCRNEGHLITAQGLMLAWLTGEPV
jgi:4'-phosphopantetheinyl transferase EntD